MKILFICKYNIFRSRFAEGFFNKVNKIKAKSAGLIMGSVLNKNLKQVAREFDLDINSEPKSVSEQLLNWADKVIIVADDVPKEIFKKYSSRNKIIVWKIKDSGSEDIESIRKTVKDIKSKVERL